MWGTKKTNKTVVVTIQGQVKTARTKPNGQHLEQVDAIPPTQVEALPQAIFSKLLDFCLLEASLIL